MAEENRCPQCGDKLPANAPRGVCPKCLIKVGLPSGADVDKTPTPDEKSDVPTSATPPGRFVPPEPAQLARQFPQLEILELLGQGGMGAVYRARQKQLDRLVALKILPPEVGQDPAFAERFTREARSMAVFNHPHIVTVYDFGHTEEGLYYFIMEFVDGTDLRQVIQAGELKPSEALAIVPQICEALQFAHEEGIVHRDIKPENILMDKKGRVKIADFGLARLLDRPTSAYTLTAAGHKMGTPHYMAPEQIEHPHEVDHRADIYSLGVVFYEMLTGQLPIGQFAPPSQKVQVDVRLDKVVLKSLAHEPERRYQHASEIKTDVESISYEAHPILSAGRRLQTITSRDETEAARRRVRGPAIGLTIAGIFNGLLLPGFVPIIVPTFFRDDSIWRSLLGSNVFFLVIGLLLINLGWMAVIIFGSTKMRELEAYWLAVASAILAAIPIVPGCLLGMPIGIWALSVLTRRDVRQAFRKHAGVEPSAAEPSEAEAIQQQVKRPAIGLLITGIVNWIGITVALLILTPIMVRQHKSGPGPDPEAVLWAVALIAIVFSGLIIFAELKMMRLE
ncbi:MAG: serine/threonine protein kinase, partial [Planctomycetota bacterium]